MDFQQTISSNASVVKNLLRAANSADEVSRNVSAFSTIFVPTNLCFVIERRMLMRRVDECRIHFGFKLGFFCLGVITKYFRNVI